jgi:hypothetical protein
VTRVISFARHGVNLQSTTAKSARNFLLLYSALAVNCSMCIASAPAKSTSGDESANATVAKPIRGFHPIRKALAPIENLEGQGIKLEQDIMKLSGPISELQPSMVKLDKTMISVESQMGKMQTELASTYAEVAGARKDIAGMRKDVHSLKVPVISLKRPIEQLSGPLAGIKQQLCIITWVIFASAVAVALGTPLACVLFWKYRARLMPKISKELEAPVAAAERDIVEHDEKSVELEKASGASNG